MKRMIIVALLVLITGLAGCAELPRPTSATEPVRPALTVDQARELHRTLVARMKAADRRHSPRLAAEVLGGPALQGRTADYAKLVGWRRPLPVFEGGDTVLTVASPVAATYPRRAILVLTRTPSKHQSEDRLLGVVERRTAGEPWKLLVSIPARAKDLPALAVDQGGISPPAPHPVVPTPRQLANAVADPAKHRAHFAQTSTLVSFRHSLDADNRASEHDSFRLSVDPLPGQYVVATRGGGALVVTTVRVQVTRQMADDWYFYYPRGRALHRAYPGKYAAGTDTFLGTYLVVVPSKGTIKSVGLDVAWVGDTARPFAS